MSSEELYELLEDRVERYNNPEFIVADPISIPHRYSHPQDIEIAGFWTAMLSWGQRKTIINKANLLFDLMGPSPHDFIVNHAESDRAPLLKFVHRTFQPTDTVYFLHFFQQYYRKHDSLQDIFKSSEVTDVRSGLVHFHNVFFDSAYAPQRTRKHVSTPMRKASCKRLNMFLRWMVRSDDNGVDFGIWDCFEPHQLMIPLDVHVMRIASRLGLLKRDKADWQAVEELTQQLIQFDPNDPVKYDFALFGMGILE